MDGTLVVWLVAATLILAEPLLVWGAEVAFDTAPGWKNVRFQQLPAAATKPVWMRFDFQPAAETFELYVPRTFQRGQPCGALAWIDPTDDGTTPHKFAALFDEFHLVALSAKKCGNGEQTARRIGLLASGLLELSKTIKLDGARCVVSGLSGGGRAAATACFAMSDFWRGAISWCGGNYWEDYPTAQQPGKLTIGINHYKPERITPGLVAAARKNCRFVLLTGPRDMNLENSHDLEAVLKQNGFAAQLIEEPGLGHEVGSPASMRAALEFVLGKPPEK